MLCVRTVNGRIGNSAACAEMSKAFTLLPKVGCDIALARVVAGDGVGVDQQWWC